jgi:hypothetical protein
MHHAHAPYVVSVEVMVSRRDVSKIRRKCQHNASSQHRGWNRDCRDLPNLLNPSNDGVEA